MPMPWPGLLTSHDSMIFYFENLIMLPAAGNTRPGLGTPTKAERPRLGEKIFFAEACLLSTAAIRMSGGDYVTK